MPTPDNFRQPSNARGVPSYHFMYPTTSPRGNETCENILEHQIMYTMEQDFLEQVPPTPTAQVTHPQDSAQLPLTYATTLPD